MSDDDTGSGDDDEDLWEGIDDLATASGVDGDSQANSELLPRAGNDREHHAGLLPSEVVSEKWKIAAMKRREYLADSGIGDMVQTTDRASIILGQSTSLSEEDRETIRAVSLFVTHHLSRDTWRQFSETFRDVDLPSLPHAMSLIHGLSGLEPMAVDCCVNSCCAFTATRESSDVCDLCHEPRYVLSPSGIRRPRKQYYHIPLARRLVHMYESRDLAIKMRYRVEVHEQGRTDDRFTDVFDGSHYRKLLDKDITVMGFKGFGAKYFEGERDIALGISTDGFAPFRRRRHSAWPILIFNYSLPPSIRFHQENILPIGVIPGPKAVRDINSFLEPLVDELVQLAAGIPALDAHKEEIFCLRAHLIVGFGDIPAISKLMRMLGHNAKFPCRFCSIQGVRNPEKPNVTTHYVPLDRTCLPEQPSYDPLNLPMRVEAELREQARKVSAAPSVNAAKKLASDFGIKGLSCLARFGSVRLTTSFPTEFMHLFLENVIKHLVSLWTGTFKDVGLDEHEISPSNWKKIGAETAVCGSAIPSQFGPSLPNIAESQSEFTADAWCVWTLFVAPVLLHGRFCHEKCYLHFMELVRLLRICLQFSLTCDDIQTIRLGFANWNVEYERSANLSTKIWMDC